MSTASLPQPRVIKRNKRKRQESLVAAAIAVFADVGYDAASTREIAERAGCSESLIYRYFGGKRGLLQAIMEQARVDTTQEMLSPALERDSLEEEIRDVLLSRLAITWARRDMVRATYPPLITDKDLGREVGETMHKQAVAYLMEKLERHERAGHIRQGMNLEATANGIAAASMYLGFICQIVWQLDRDHVREMAVALAASLCRGLSVQDEQTRRNGKKRPDASTLRQATFAYRGLGGLSRH